MPTATLQPWGTIHRTGRFRDVNGVVWTIKAADGAVFAAVSHNLPIEITLPAGTVIAEPIYFEQFVDTLIMMRGPDLDPLQLTDLAVGFTAVPNPTAPGRHRIPRGSRAITAGTRLWVMTGTDIVWASDSLDHTSYELAINRQFRITDGTPDNMVTMAVFNETDLVCGKERSIWRITNIVGNLSDTEVLPVTHQYGCVAADSMVDIGTDLWWWSQDGPASLTITEFNELQTTAGAQRPMPSTDIRPLVARVNSLPQYRSRICAAVWDRKVYFGVPLDDADSVLRHEKLSGNYIFKIGSPILTIPAVIGARYRYVPGAHEVSLVDGGTTYTVSADFVAETDELVLTGTNSGTSVTGSLRQIFKGNNAILVCDLDLVDPQTGYGTWQGYDQAAGIEPKQFFLTEYVGKDRLCFDGLDGWCCLYEEGYEDANPEPYVDVTLDAVPAVADTVRINSGDIVVAEAQNTNNVSGGAFWGIGTTPTLATAQTNLWTSVLAGVETGGYSLNAQTGRWSAPGTEPIKLSNGVRFYSTEFILPTAGVTGSALETTFALWVPIETDFLSRGYRKPEPVSLQRGLVLAAQLQTWHPQYSLALKPGGVFEEAEVVSDQTRSRVKYDKPAFKADWDPSNINDDFDTPGRQDYSLNLADGGFRLGDRLGVGLHQEMTHPVPVGNKRARAMQVRLTGDLGRTRIIALGYESHVGDRGMGVKI